MSVAFDKQMMGIAMRVAQRGLGQVSPNPAVGTVIADEASGEVIARGWTQPGGRPHAETEAIARAGDKVRGATMYVTLEPCSHHGKTGPCADAIIEAGLRRAVVAIGDPDERVAGRGLARLRDAGIRVETGLMADEARWLTLGHILRVTQQRPFVQVKMALSADGEVPRGGAGSPTWVTSPDARAHGALLRAEADAIVVGAQTIVDDDPLLTCRLPGLEARSPKRVVLSAKLDVPAEARVFATALQVPTLVITTTIAERGDRAAKLRDQGVEIIRQASRVDGGYLRGALAALAESGLTRLLVEGGPRVWRAMSDADVVDEVVVFQAGDAGVGAVKAAAQRFVNLDGFADATHRQLVQDVVATFRAKR